MVSLGEDSAYKLCPRVGEFVHFNKIMPAGEHMAVQNFITSFMAFQRYDDRGRHRRGDRGRGERVGEWVRGLTRAGIPCQPGSNGDSAVREYLLMSTMLQGVEGSGVGWVGVEGVGH